jgi:hypothetical protein
MVKKVKTEDKVFSKRPKKVPEGYSLVVDRKSIVQYKFKPIPANHIVIGERVFDIALPLNDVERELQSRDVRRM